MDVACLLLPNFLVALARRDNPALRGRPIVIGGSPEEHSAVAACSGEAADAGVAIGTTLRRALALCPDAVFLPLREGQLQGESAAIVDQLCLYSPVIEAIEPGHVHFEIRGLPELARMTAKAWLADLQDAVVASTGLPVRLAAAPTVFAAHAANYGEQMSGLRDAVLLEGASTEAFLARLPIEVLPVSAAMHQRLRLFGLVALGQVARLPFAAMQAQFGREGARAWRLAHGVDDSLVLPAAEELRLVEDIELPGPTALSEPLIIGTRGLIQRALERPEVRGRSLRRVDWRTGLENGEQITRRSTFREPTSDAVRILFTLRAKIERLQLPAAAITLGVTLSGFCSEYGHQGNLWRIGPRRWKELVESVEHLHARAGEAQVFRVVEVQPWSRIPERQLGLVAFGS